MKIAVIGQTPLKQELASRKIPPGWEWVWVDFPQELDGRPDIRLCFDLDFVPDENRIEMLGRLLPAPVLINSMVHTLSGINRPFIRIAAWPGFLERSTHELAVTDKKTADSIAEIYKALDWQYRIVPDTPGMISARILSAIINEAYHTLQDQVSTKTEIDTAMKLGTNYPMGPFEWSKHIGLEKIDQLLTALSDTESRYTPSQALKYDLRSQKN
jgi:3-hydroxybutyryl-CoA dehydrogenase